MTLLEILTTVEKLGAYLDKIRPNDKNNSKFCDIFLKQKFEEEIISIDCHSEFEIEVFLKLIEIQPKYHQEDQC